MENLSNTDIELVSGGQWDWDNIGRSIGYNIGKAAGYVYDNILIGNGAVDDLANATVGGK